MDSQREAFEAALKADPYDKDTRLVYADWLEEHGTLPTDPELAQEQREWTKEKYDARLWLEGFVEELNAGLTERYGDYEAEEDAGWPPRKFLLDADGLLAAAEEYLKTGDYFRLGFDTPDLLHEKREEFWHNFAILKGKDIEDTERHMMFFSCSC